MLHQIFERIPKDPVPFPRDWEESFGPLGPFNGLSYLSYYLTKELLVYGPEVLIWRTFPSSQLGAKVPFGIAVNLEDCLARLKMGLSLDSMVSARPSASLPPPPPQFAMRRDNFRTIVFGGCNKAIHMTNIEKTLRNNLRLGHDCPFESEGTISLFVDELGGMTSSPDCYYILYIRALYIRFYQILRVSPQTEKSKLIKTASKLDEKFNEVLDGTADAVLGYSQDQKNEFQRKFRKVCQWQQLLEDTERDDGEVQAARELAIAYFPSGFLRFLNHDMPNPQGMNHLPPSGPAAYFRSHPTIAAAEADFSPCPDFKQLCFRAQTTFSRSTPPDLGSALHILSKTGIACPDVLMCLKLLKGSLKVKIAAFQESIRRGSGPERIEGAYKDATSLLVSHSLGISDIPDQQTFWLPPENKK
jgi:hypothetical protein